MMHKRPPNILFLFPDQHRADWTGLNPNLRLKTPNLDRLQAHGTTAHNTFTPSPICAPARACLASGQDYTRCGVSSNRDNLPLDKPTYYQSLRSAGYEVSGVGKFDLHKNLAAPLDQLDWGIDGSLNLADWGFTSGIDNEGKRDAAASYLAAGHPKGPYMSALHQEGWADCYAQEIQESRPRHRNAYTTRIPEHLYLDNWIADNGLRLLQNFSTQRPWHLVVNFAGPHEPMDVTPGMAEACKDRHYPPPHKPAQDDYSAEDHQRNRRHYAAMIENIDRHIGRFLEAVRARGEEDNTFIVYSSDHGEMLGDHGLWGKGVWRDAAVRIPLIALGPTIPQGHSTRALVCLHDLAATFLELAGAPPLPDTDARSCLPILCGEDEQHRSHAISALGDWRCIQDQRYKAVVQQDHAPALYDLEADPGEDRDISSEKPGILNSLLAHF